MKKSKKIITILIIIMVLILIFFTILVIKNIKKEQQNTVEDEIIVKNDNNAEQNIKKITGYETKTNLYEYYKDETSYVTLATYEGKNTVSEYTSLGGNIVYDTKLKAPYINLDSEDIKQVNNEIKLNYEKYSAYFGQKRDQEIMDSNIDYYVYENDGIISIVYVLKYSIGDDAEEEVYVYNIDTTTGELLTYRDVYLACGYSEDSLEEINKNIENFEKIETDFGDYNEIDENKYFIDENKNLSFIYTQTQENVCHGIFSIK